MIVVISPAKTLELERTQPFDGHTIPQFLEETKLLVGLLKKKKTEELMALMEISADLAKFNFERYQDWKTPFTQKNARQAVFTFNGPVYQGFDFFGYDKAAFERLQKTVRIISGLHGLLRPYDLIQPYRLDMHIPLKNPAGADLYAYWKQKITDALNKECKDVLVNCLSVEYAAAIDFSQIKCQTIAITFKNYRNGKYIVMGLLAKKARGMFADFVVRQNVSKIEDLKKFNRDGYIFDPKTSKPNELVFLRKRKG